MQHARAAQIMAVGDAACLVRLSSRPGPGTSQKVLALVAALDANPPPGLVEVIPAYASILVRFDPLTINPASMMASLRAVLGRADDSPPPRGRLIRIPVCYGGDNGPDLEEVAHHLGMTPSELIRCHVSATYRVAFLGFMAGFPYLTGLPRALVVPRLSTPRIHVPAGSVAIADRQAGIYPVESPGGWRILGRTSAPLFDAARTPPSLLFPGDRVRFFPTCDIDQASIGAPDLDPKRITNTWSMPWVRVMQPGIQTTVQDQGRTGFARYGVSTSGAADPAALALGNALLTNPPEAAALEITGGGSRFEALAPCVVAVTGAPCVLQVNQRQVPMGVTYALAAGDTLELGVIMAGMRAYLCVGGGVAAPQVMGSRATDVRARIGGLDGRPLLRDDVLARGHAITDAAGRILPQDRMYRVYNGGDWHIRVLPGPHAAESPNTFRALLAASFAVDARSDRVGVRLRRLDGPCLDGGQVLSEGLARGAVQVPPDGEPVLLLADAQTTGGYRVPAVVISADLWKIGQFRPGNTVRFQGISPAEALAALRQHADEIARVARQPSSARLLSGFAEWSEDADPTMPRRKDSDNGK